MSEFLRIFKRSTPYIKELRPICKSVTAVILFQQLEYWFEKYPDGFYKFIEPSEMAIYKKGDSWSEELAFSAEEFRTAFSKIGIAHNSKTAFLNKKSDGMQFLAADGTEMFYCSVYDRTTHITWYYRNNNFVEDTIDDFIESLKSKKEQEPQVTENNNPDLRKTRTPSYGKQQSQVRYTDSTTESTSENKDIDHLPSASDRTHDKNQLSLFSDQEFEAKMQRRFGDHSLSISKGIDSERSDLPRPICGKVYKSSEAKEAYQRAFDLFWEQYPRKTAKAAAVKAWGKLKASGELLNTIMHDIANRKQNDHQWRDPAFVPHPATYLNGQRWQDEIVKAPVLTNQKTSVQSEQDKKDQARMNAVRRLQQMMREDAQ